ncbi:MAG: TOMM precursor leader peptide-binding protein [bacterium]|jgi:bacteriocin biosynthesis cyclodehydratase domain-containing protein|nr:TOMM precursor leader peptide-binding protein [bacterium]
MKTTLTYRYPRLIHSVDRPISPDFMDPSGGERELWGSLLPLLDGQHSLEEIYGKLLIDGFAAEAIFHAMETLEDHHWLGEMDSSLPHGLTQAEARMYAPQIQRFQAWNREYHNMDPSGNQTEGEEVQIKLKQSTVLVVGLENSGKELLHSLACAGVGCLIGITNSPVFTAEEIGRINPFIQYHEIHHEQELVGNLRDRTVNVIVYSPDRFDEEYCQTLNRLALSTNTPFLPIRHNPTSIELGPLVIPHESACYTCYDRRRKAAVPYLAAPAKQQTGTLFNFPVGVGFITIEIIKFLSYCAEPITKGRLWRLNLLRGLSDVHPVLKLPRCPSCGVHRHTPPSKLWEE